ncbi:LpqB family beta-propeller domain-containing protein [Blastopirellula marina]|uniref:Cytochrome c domain-containing protein n=1 Tax=Blastopirellula marina TaxID=124 RepID=A0A2S8GJY0_9BACT|nr:c-type cytochrome domain-containing protein [Blastopirellula marina]PQO44747.1 hypothetical protein C5Y93_18465 [Blastopirellula marina]
MRLFALHCVVSLACCASVYADPIPIAELKRDKPVSFEQEILPIFRQSCLACHSDSERYGDLAIENPAQMKKGGDSGPAIVPGKGADSLLIKLAAHQQESFMPPPDNDVNAPQLTSQQLGLIRLWIDQGAEGGPATAPATPWKWESLPGVLNPIYALALSEDGKQVAVTRANQLYVYDVATGQMTAQLLDTALQPAAAHRDLTKTLAWSSDGRLLASGGFREVKLWEKPRDARLTTLETGAASTAIAVSGDRKQLAIATDKLEIQLFSAENAQPGVKLTGHAGPITAVEFTSDGQRLVSASQDGTIRVWNRLDGSPVVTLTSPSPVDAMTLLPSANPAEQRLVAGGADKTLRIWTIPTAPTEEAAAPDKEFPAHDNAITSLAAVPNQPQQVYAGSLDGTIRRWNLETAQATATFTHGAPVLGIDVRRDGQRIASVSENGTAKLWDAAGKQLAELKGDPWKQAAVARLARDQKAAEQRVTLLKKRLETAEAALQTRTEAKAETETALAAAQAEVKKQQAAVDKAGQEPAADKPDDKEAQPDPAQLLSEAQAAEKLAEQKQTAANNAVTKAQQYVDEVKRTVAAAEAKVKQTQADVAAAEQQSAESQRPLRSVRFSPDGKVVAVAGDYPSLLTYDSETGAAIGSLAEQAASLSPLVLLDDKRAVTGLAGEAVIWDLDPAWRLLRTIGSEAQPELISDRVTSLDFNAAGTELLVGGGVPSRSGELAIFQVADGSRSGHWPQAHGDTVYAAKFSPEGTEFLSAGSDKYARMWNVAVAEPVRQFEGHGDYVLGVAWKGDAQSIATVSADQTLKIWDAESTDQQRTIPGFGRDITAVVYVGELDQVLSSCGDGSVRLQNAANGQTIRTFAAGIWLHGVAATADGKLIAAGSDDGRLFLWDGATGKQLHVIQVGE